MKSGNKGPHRFITFLFSLHELDFVKRSDCFSTAAFSFSSSRSVTDINAMLVDPLVFCSSQIVEENVEFIKLKLWKNYKEFCVWKGPKADC